MNYKFFSVVSLVVTVLTCLVILNSFGGCTTEQMQDTAVFVKRVETIAPLVAPLVPGVSWPVWSVLGIDIISSLLAAVVAFRKQQSLVK